MKHIRSITRGTDQTTLEFIGRRTSGELSMRGGIFAFNKPVEVPNIYTNKYIEASWSNDFTGSATSGAAFIDTEHADVTNTDDALILELTIKQNTLLELGSSANVINMQFNSILFLASNGSGMYPISSFIGGELTSTLNLADGEWHDLYVKIPLRSDDYSEFKIDGITPADFTSQPGPGAPAWSDYGNTSPSFLIGNIDNTRDASVEYVRHVKISYGDTVVIDCTNFQDGPNNSIVPFTNSNEVIYSGSTFSGYVEYSYITDAPSDNLSYARKNGDWVEISSGGSGSEANVFGEDLSNSGFTGTGNKFIGKIDSSSTLDFTNMDTGVIIGKASVGGTFKHNSDSGLVQGISKGFGRMESTGHGSFASGYARGGSIMASGEASMARGTAYKSSDSIACFIAASNVGALASGFTNGSVGHSKLTAAGGGSSAFGYVVNYSGSAYTAEVLATGKGSMAFGNVSAEYANAAVSAIGNGAFAGGYSKGRGISANGKGAMAFGFASTSSNGNISSSADGTVAIGTSPLSVTHTGAIAMGLGLTSASNNQILVGKWNSTSSGTADFPLVLGGGLNDTTRDNLFAVSSTGEVFAKNSTINTGIDYAEAFEWEDGNPDNEDRVGLFVKLQGDKIVLAESSDDYIGIISATPSVVGDEGSIEWKDKYLKDDFGRIIYEDLQIPATLYTVTSSMKDEYKRLKSLVTLDDFQRSQLNELENTIKLEGTILEEAKEVKAPKLNPEYDSSLSYTPRQYRKEWSNVGLVGQLRVKDDNTASVGDTVVPSVGGIATKSTTGYKVIKRIKEGIIQVLVK